MLFQDRPGLRAPTVAEAAALGFTSSLGPFAVNAYLPGFHMMALDFGTDFVQIEQSLTIYLLTFAVCSIFAGTISDSIGRRKTLIGGMLIFLTASLGAAWSHTLWELYFWRFAQGIGAAVGQVVTQAVVRDRWSGIDATRMNGLIAMWFALSPALAPVIGGWIVAHFGWHSVFYFLATYAGAIALFVRFGMAETLSKDNRMPFRPGAIVSGYRMGFTHAAFMAGVASHGFCFMAMILFTAGAADFAITIMKLDVDEFAWYTFPVIAMSLTGSWASTKILRRLGTKGTVYGSSICLVLGCAVISVSQYVDDAVYPALLACPLFTSFVACILRPVMMAMNLDYFPKNRGMAASIQQFFVTGSFSVCAALWVPIVMGSAWKYAAVSSFCAFAMLTLWFISMKLRPKALARDGIRESF